MNAETEKVARGKPIPEDKVETVKELSENMKNYRTTLIASCKGLPSKQFHEIKKKLRGKAEIKVAKKRSVNLAIDTVEKGYIKNLKKELGPDIVIFFSKLDPFELSGMLSDNKSPAKAKTGDIAPENIEIEAGPTELIPGPAISELSAVGLKVSVKEGKLEIMKGAIVAKKGEKISKIVANVLGKLNIMPMEVGFVPLSAYDSEDDKIYVGIKIDKEETLEELRGLVGDALGFAINVDYVVKETISYFISKASAEEKALEKLSPKEDKMKEKPTEELKEEVTAKSDSTKQDIKEEA